MSSRGHHLVDAYWTEVGAVRERMRIEGVIRQQSGINGVINIYTDFLIHKINMGYEAPIEKQWFGDNK